ncbi:MAG: tRNA (adenosine(37)-N6)-threonylcarbamoyltransferase complex transferase subunit TsaD [bacterium]
MILAIETSCDDSAVALLNSDGSLIISRISSQTELHKKYGGIVPEIASRKHLTTLPLLLRSVMESQNLNLKDLTAVAVTYAPGLIGSLLVGVSYAKTLGWMLGIPVVPVDHLEGHLLAPFLDNSEIRFPYLALIASGGHTHLIHAQKLGSYKLLGKTMDDAAGEAYDKVAKMLGFQYPGGPVIEKLAACCPESTIDFPVPLIGKKTLNFSFSGLKTAVRNEAIRQGVYTEGKRLISFSDYLKIPDTETKRRIADIAASFQKIMTIIITRRMTEALKKTRLKQMVVTGGVAANTGIRASLAQLAAQKGIRFFYPSTVNCTDNAAMIGYTAAQHLKAGRQVFDSVLKLNASSKSPIGLMDIAV